MLKRCYFLLILAFTIVVASFACGGATAKEGAVVAVITSDLALTEMNTVRIEVSQETSPGTYGAPLIAKDFPLAAENTLPATFTIRSGKAADQNALIRVIGSKDATPVVTREVAVLIPSDRVLALPMVLAKACAGITCTAAHESCQPATGACGASLVDDSTLGTYVGPGSSVSTTNPSSDSGAVASSDKVVDSFMLAGANGVISGDQIVVSLPATTALIGLIPTITFRGAKIDPSPSTPQDFTNPVKYTVTALDGTTADYTVTVSVQTAGSAAITAFTVDEEDADIEEGDDATSIGTISVKVDGAIDLTHVAPIISITGVSVVPASGSPQDFTQPVTYTVTGTDGSTKKYSATVLTSGTVSPVVFNPDSTNPATMNPFNGPLTVKLSCASPAEIHYVMGAGAQAVAKTDTAYPAGGIFLPSGTTTTISARCFSTSLSPTSSEQFKIYVVQ